MSAFLSMFFFGRVLVQFYRFLSGEHLGSKMTDLMMEP
jgi:hypothetical protein